MLLQTLAFRSFTSMTLNKLLYSKRAEEGKERAWCLLSADEKRWDGERPSQMRREGSSAVDQSLIKNIKLFISFQAAWTKLKCLRTESIHRRLSISQISVIHEMLSLCVTVFREAHGHVDNKNWPGINDKQFWFFNISWIQTVPDPNIILIWITRITLNLIWSNQNKVWVLF